jgi:hypothetical protein
VEYNNINNNAMATTMRLLVESIATEALLRAQDASHSQHYHFTHSPPPHYYDVPPPPPPPPFWHFVGLIPFIKKVIFYSVLGFVLFITSLGMYGVFYKSVMPVLTVSETLYFDYTGIARHPSKTTTTVNVGSQYYHYDDERTAKITTSTLIDTSNETVEALSTRDQKNEKRRKKTKKEIVEEEERKRKNNNDVEPVTETPMVPTSPNADRRQQQQLFLRRRQPWLMYAPWAATDLFSVHSHWDPGTVLAETFEWSHEHDDNVDGREPAPDEGRTTAGQRPEPLSTFQMQHLNVLPPLKTSTRILSKNTPHFLEVLLDLPESEHNRRVGLFGVHVQLQSSNSTVLASSMRTARLPHESRWVSVLRKILCIVPLMIGALEESRRITVPSFRFYVESQESPLRFVTVRLVAPSAITKERQTQQQQQECHYSSNDDSMSMWVEDAPEVLRGYLHVGKELTAFQELLKEWFFTCAAVGVSFFFLIQFLLVFAVQTYWSSQTEATRRRQQQDVHTDFDNASEVFGRHTGFDRDANSDGFTGGGEWEDMNNSLHSNGSTHDTAQQNATSQTHSIPQEIQTEDANNDDGRDYVPFDDDDDDEGNWSSMSPRREDIGGEINDRHSTTSDSLPAVVIDPSVLSCHGQQ